MLDIRARQIDCLTAILKANNGVTNDSGGDNETAYKVLILDAACRDIVAPLLKLNQLRSLGVTLHLALESERQPIREVPAVYLVRQSNQNVDRILKDLSADLYESYRLNFVSRISRPMLESLAQGAVKASAVQKVMRVEDQYMDFTALESGLFSLGLSGMYAQLHNPSVKDTEIAAAVERIVDGLFCVFVTLGALPIMKCQSGGAAEHICSALDDRIRTALKMRNNLFSEAGSGLLSSLSRPVLIVFDRNFDLSAALQHSWSYKPLVQVTVQSTILMVIMYLLNVHVDATKLEFIDSVR